MTPAAATDRPTTCLDILGDETASNPWPLLRALREQGPVVWHERYRRWLITTDKAVRKIVVDHRRFTVEGTTVEDLFGADAFIAMDDRRRHDQLRNIWADAFRKQGLDRLIPVIRRVVDDLIAPVAERLRSGEAVDLSTSLCRALPTMLIALMMGVPDEMLPELVRWSDAMSAGGPAYMSEAEGTRLRQAREDAKSALADFLGGMILRRRRQPGDDLISTLIHSAPGSAMSDARMVPNLRQLLFAGNETTAKWLGQIFVTYAEQPDIRRQLVADNALIPAANDEVMRWQGVVGTLVRRVRGGPITVDDVELADGDEITCLLSSANRDPERYADPDRFDIHRVQQPNMGFGVGLHNCLGSVLAKLEAETVVGALLREVPEFVVGAPYSYTKLPMRGPLPVTLEACRA